MPMRFCKACIGLLLLLGMVACGSGNGSSTTANSGPTPTPTPTKTLVSISVEPSNPNITTGATQTFTATGTYSDSSTQDLTASVTWSSSNTSVATISNATGTNGIATSMGAGATTITASSGNIFGIATLTVVAAPSAGANIMQVTVNGALCSAATSANYPNKPCVSVTVCAPGSTTNCQTITDILLDTGSSGLRILNQALTVPLTQVASGSGLLAECIQFGDGSSEWGPVQMASVILGNEPAVQIPIHVVNQSFAAPPGACNSRQSTPDTSPFEAGFNGILGVGLFAQDCGSLCTTSANNGQYYSCNGTTCTGTKVPNANQVINPVAALSVDNNGVIVELPSVALGGVASVNGSLILGIGTQTNNQPPTTVTGYPADPTYGQFTTSFNGDTFTDECFIDSGSNSLYFDDPTIVQCSSSSSGSGYFCPSSTLTLSAKNSGYSGSPSGTVNFYIGNATTLFNTSNNVFIELGANSSDFDWGLPFFLGRNVFIGIEGTQSSLGTGPYWAY